MSDPAILIGSILVLCIIAAMIAYIIMGRRQQKRGGYQWQPEQDYDVVQSGEGPMTPSWPRLVKRETKKNLNSSS